MNKLIVSSSPHFHAKDTTAGIMLDVIIALTPAMIASVIIFGFRAAVIILTTVASCILSEYLSRVVMKRRQTVGDLSCVVTGILLAMNLPVSINPLIAAFGGVVAIVVVKQMFGGIGQNFVNPALVGRIVLMASFPVQMSDYPAPFAWRMPEVAAVTSATPLAQFSDIYGAENLQSAMDTAGLPSLLDMLFGVRGGCLGETCAIALLLGFVYLLIRRVISPTIPLMYVGTVAVIMLIAGKGNFEFVAYQLLSGGLLLGAIFMATDYTTSPVNFKGKLLYAFGCGLITALIRIFASLPEGVSFSILLMNILVPHLDRLTTPKPFGTRKEKKRKKEAAS